MSLENITRGTVLAENVVTLNASFTKTLELMRSKGFPGGYALWINPCKTIYTSGMREAVDIIFIDKDAKVIKVFKSLPPFCIAQSTKEAVSALELRRNTIERTRTRIGDKLRIKLY
ncbi:MAG: hypothetical protein B6D63_00925 [Candidatus Latescibacteria bacterium 4484_7]|nr:MAG: hypothetical protein B6D63_00925 [Candidatus Latescibacteria bacterium 4484_7]